MTCNLYKQREQQIKGLIKKSKLSQLEISTHYFQEPLFAFAKLSENLEFWISIKSIPLMKQLLCCRCEADTDIHATQSEMV